MEEYTHRGRGAATAAPSKSLSTLSGSPLSTCFMLSTRTATTAASYFDEGDEESSAPAGCCICSVYGLRFNNLQRRKYYYQGSFLWYQWRRTRLENNWGNGKVICRANDESQIYIRNMMGGGYYWAEWVKSIWHSRRPENCLPITAIV